MKSMEFFNIFFYGGYFLASIFFLIGVSYKCKNEKLIKENIDYTRKNQELSTLSFLDFLTGIYNRRKIIEVGNMIFKDMKAKKLLGMSVSIIDIDNFKYINDKYGHGVGDLVLRELSNILRTTGFREMNYGRFGGEEFLLIFSDATPIKSKEMLEEIRNKISEANIKVNGERISITISCGICEYIEGDDLESMIYRSDQALYKAKNSGKNRVEASYKNVQFTEEIS